MPLGSLGLELEPPELDLSFIWCVRESLNVYWVTAAISGGVQSPLLRKSDMGNIRMGSYMHSISWAHLMVPPGVCKVKRVTFHCLSVPITMYLYFIALLFIHTYITINKASNWLYCERDMSYLTGFLILLRNYIWCFLRQTNRLITRYRPSCNNLPCNSQASATLLEILSILIIFTKPPS